MSETSKKTYPDKFWKPNHQRVGLLLVEWNKEQDSQTNMDIQYWTTCTLPHYQTNINNGQAGTLVRRTHCNTTQCHSTRPGSHINYIIYPLISPLYLRERLQCSLPVKLTPLSLCLPVTPSLFLSVCLSLCLSVCLSLSLCLPLSLSLQYVCLPASLALSLPLSL